MEREVYIPRRNQIARAVSERLLSSTLLRSEIVNPENLDVARESLQERGLCILANHPSSGDARLMKLILGDRLLRKKEVAVPIAAHIEKPYINVFSHLLRVDLRYIVTDDTIDRAKEKGKSIPEKNEGMREFLDDALRVFSNKGVAPVFPEARRNQVMNAEASPRTVGHLLASAKRKNVGMGFLFVGINLPDAAKDGLKADGYNLGKKYKLVIGKYMTDEELLEKAGGKFSGADSVVYEELAFLVSPKYADISLRK